METSEHAQQYERKLGKFKPKFHGKPDDYYELSNTDVATGFCLCTTIVVVFFFLSVGFFMWSARVSTSNLILFSSILLCIFVPLFMVGAFLGSKNKMEIEERLIKKALEKIMERKEAKKDMNGYGHNINQTQMTLNENDLHVSFK